MPIRPGRPPHDDLLTPAEWRIVHCVRHGMTNRAIAERRGVSIDAVGQIARSVKDIKKSEVWYRDILGLRHLYTFDNLAFFDCGGARLMLSQGESFQANESLLYLRVSDIDVAYERLQESGVDFTSAPHMIHRHEDGTEEWMSFFKDPEGRDLAIMASVSANV